MKIKTLWSWEVGEKLSGLVVVADVWAATTNLAVFLDRGVRELFLVDKRAAMEAKTKDEKVMIVGEDVDLGDEFFEVSNHPSEIVKKDWQGKEVYYMSTNGVRVMRGMVDRGAEEIVGLSLVNIEAVVEWVRGQKAAEVSLVAAGERTYADKLCPEDMGVVKMAERLLKGRKLNWQREVGEIEKRAREYYGGEDLRWMDKDGKVIFKANSVAAVPVGRRLNGGLIKVSKAVD